MEAAGTQLELVDARGLAAHEGAADAAPDRLRKALKALEKLKSAMDNNSFREAAKWARGRRFGLFRAFWSGFEMDFSDFSLPKALSEPYSAASA